MTTTRAKRAALVIIDGVGLDPDSAANGATAQTLPTLHGAMERYGHAVLEASGPAVGLEPGQVGNSEVGHLTIGLGRVELSSLAKINAAFESGGWAAHPAWESIAAAGCLHVVGMVSDAGVHAHWRTIRQAVAIAHEKRIPRILVHALLDGVDSPSGSAPELLSALTASLADLGDGVRPGLVMGRKWFTDRSGKPEVTRRFTDALTGVQALPEFSMAALARHLESAGEAEFPPHLAEGGRRVVAGEPVLITSHRADRARQAARSLDAITPVYAMVTLGDAVVRERVFFPTEPIREGMAFTLRSRGLSATRIAEDCKFPHVSFFFNGFNETLGERHIRIPALDADPAERPEMRAAEVAAAAAAEMAGGTARALVVNLANCDQVGHTGDLALVTRAARHVDEALRTLLAAARQHGWTVILTSDHGNAETLRDRQGRPFGSHTANPVPFTVVPAEGNSLRWRTRTGTLTQVAASFLTLLGIEPDAGMAPPLVGWAD